MFLPHPTVVSQKYRPGNTDLTTLTLKRGSKGCSTSALSHAGLRVSVSAFSLQFVLHAAHTLSCEYQPPTGFHRFSTYISVVLDDCSTGSCANVREIGPVYFNNLPQMCWVGVEVYHMSFRHVVWFFSLRCFPTRQQNWSLLNNMCVISFSHYAVQTQQRWSCIVALGHSVYPLIMRLRPAPTYSGDEWNFVCGAHSQGRNFHNRILKILLKFFFLFLWILCEGSPSIRVPHSCRPCVSEIPQRSFRNFQRETICLASRVYWFECCGYTHL